MVTTNFRVTAPLRARLGSTESRTQDENNGTKLAHFEAQTTLKSTFAAPATSSVWGFLAVD